MMLLGFAFTSGLSLGRLIGLVAAINPEIIPTALLGTAVVFVCFSLAALYTHKRKGLLWVYNAAREKHTKTTAVPKSAVGMISGLIAATSPMRRPKLKPDVKAKPRSIIILFPMFAGL